MRLWPDELNYLSTLNHRERSLVGSEDYEIITNVMQNKIMFNDISVVVPPAVLKIKTEAFRWFVNQSVYFLGKNPVMKAIFHHRTDN